jgi:hypothetical protein
MTSSTWADMGIFPIDFVSDHNIEPSRSEKMGKFLTSWEWR